jgi:tetratricopeptide (TPR) repeat protein
MRKVLLGFLLCGSIGVGLAFAQAAKPPGKKQAPDQPVQTPDALAITQSLALVKAAGIYLELGDKDSAETQALAALKVAQTDGLAAATKNKITEDVKILLERISTAKQAAANKAIQDKKASDERAMQKHRAQIQEAEYLLSQGKPGDASKILQSVLNETEDPEVRSQAIALSGKVNSASSHTRNTLEDHVGTIFWWVVDIGLGGLVLFGIYALLKWGRRSNAAQYRNRWTVNPIDDKSELGMAGAIVESLNRWKEGRVPASAGLLKLGGIPIPTFPDIVNIELDLDLGAALADLKLEVGTVSIGGMAKAAGSIRAWFRALRPSISGNAAVSGDQVVVRLTRRTADGTRNSVTASAEKANSAYAAEAASFKMYYLIASDTNVPEAESANKLREGMSLLREYLLGRGPEKLTSAYENFRDAHLESPTLHEAYLYEGIALDLLERHDDAIMTFQYLAEPSNGCNENLRKKARYNEAVSLFRKYTRADLDRAIQIFAEVVGPAPNPTQEALAASPVKALAYAAKANAIAHKVIFWQEYFYPSPEKDDLRIIFGRKSAKGPEVRDWFREAEQIANVLVQVHTSVAAINQAWDEVTRRQLKWAIDNARGNNFLNYARSFLQQPHVVGANEEEQRREYIDQAFRAFRNSEMILTPGVETLANLGTVLIELSRQAEARSYLERIIKLNPQYEYAYYRLAESWEKENKRDKVVETLRAFAKVKTPVIRNFKALYAKYATELALG